MKNTAHLTTAERVGRWLGRAWRGCVQQEAHVIQWLVKKGIPAGVGRLLLWLAKLTVVVALLYVAFWFAVLLLIGVVAAWIAQNSGKNEENKPEWREGHSGFGLYDKNEWRHDMGDPDEP
jgi:fatty acid desaturase